MAKEDFLRHNRGLSKRQVELYNAQRRRLALAADRPRNFIGEDGLDRFAQGSLRLYLYFRDAGQCQYCGIELDWDAARYDHIVPYDDDGPTTAENMVVACNTCNRLKGNDLIPEHLRPDTSGDYEAWLKTWDGRNPFPSSDPYLTLGIPDDLDMYDPENEEKLEMALSDVPTRYRPDPGPHDPEDDACLYDAYEIEPS